MPLKQFDGPVFTLIISLLFFMDENYGGMLKFVFLYQHVLKEFLWNTSGIYIFL